jgi:glycine/D-amino acid oxidase-like deaminating enzyme/nitrite reductase/ring-hydroxylating ferredoxin subunit
MSTTPIWQATSQPHHCAALTRDASTDVCIVGAGIAGLSTAYFLAKAGRRVVVLDDGPIGSGETGRTTAHLTAAMDDRIHVLEQVHGEEGARRIVESHTVAINRIELVVRAEGIECDFRRVDGYLYLAAGDSHDTLEKELAAAHRAGLADVRLVDRAPIPQWESGPALVFPQQAQFHPLNYLHGLATAIEQMGGQIHCGTHVQSIEGGDPCVVHTSDQRTITAAAVCVCTNASISDMVKTHALQAPYRSYVVALSVPRGSVTPALYWDTGNPYVYVRTQPIDPPADGTTRGDTLMDALIVGGEDHRTGEDEDAEARWQRLERWARERWPAARDVLYRWSGQVLEPNDYAAFIGPNPDGARNIYMASGDSGQGITHGTIAGLLLTDLITGVENPWATVYDPRRVSLRARPVAEALHHNVDVAMHMVGDWISPDRVSLDAIPPGEGRVVRDGMKKMAVYRDPGGTLHYRSAVCTHLRCVVDWNGAEKSWDCPCHGSRFDPMGKVLNGPAIEDLGQV